MAAMYTSFCSFIFIRLNDRLSGIIQAVINLLECPQRTNPLPCLSTTPYHACSLDYYSYWAGAHPFILGWGPSLHIGLGPIPSSSCARPLYYCSYLRAYCIFGSLAWRFHEVLALHGAWCMVHGTHCSKRDSRCFIHFV